MSKILKYVPVFFFWLAGLTLSAHILIPHDHHIADHYSTQDKNCPESYNKSENKPGFPIHCHALNILVSERTTNFPLHQSLSEYSGYFVPGTILTIGIPPVKNITTTIFGQQPTFLKQFFFTTHSLRAPPANA